jgi:hypothetical protein
LVQLMTTAASTLSPKLVQRSEDANFMSVNRVTHGCPGRGPFWSRSRTFLIAWPNEQRIGRWPLNFMVGRVWSGMVVLAGATKLPVAALTAYS